MEISRWCSERRERNHRTHADSGLAPEGRRIRATVRAAPAGAEVPTGEDPVACATG